MNTSLATLIVGGFDLSTKIIRDGSGRFCKSGFFRVKCSQCEAAVINRVPCHETGCPNLKGES